MRSLCVARLFTAEYYSNNYLEIFLFPCPKVYGLIIANRKSAQQIISDHFHATGGGG